MNKLAAVFVTFLMALAAAGAARADAIIAPVSVVATPAGNCCSSNFVVGNLINQSGLSASYVNGVTDFSTFVATTTHSDPSSSNGYASKSGVNTVDFDFDFGSTVAVERFALWNDTDFQAIGNFEIFVSADDSFTALTSLGAFTATIAGLPRLAQVFDIADATGRYFRLHASATTGSSNLLNFGEIAFDGSLDVQQVPAPAPLALLGFGLAALGFIRKPRAA